MRFMVMVKANKDTEAGVMPSEELLAEMGKFNEGADSSLRDLQRHELGLHAPAGDGQARQRDR